MAKVSIITPCYNGAKYINKCIDSVLSQTFSDWEMLIIDDCSTDNSVEIIHRYACEDSRIKYYRTDSPSGSPSQPRNIGIDNATSRYIAFLDCDDIWCPRKLEEQLSIFEERKCPLVFSNYEKISALGERSNRIVFAPPIVDIRRMYYGNPIGCLTVMVDTEITGKFHFKRMHHEDCIAWIELITKFGPAYNTNSTLAYYRESQGSVSRNKFKILSWQWNIYRKIFKFNTIKSVIYYVIYVYYGYKKYRI